jgi:hypothetical protein
MGLNRLLQIIQGMSDPYKVINGCIDIRKAMTTPGTVETRQLTCCPDRFPYDLAELCKAHHVQRRFGA